ncbi:MAG: N-acetyltransferase family protein [Kofleriaceae bacterium]
MIRSPRDDDWPDVAAITNHYIATTTIHFGYDPVTPTALRDLCLAGARYPWFVAEEAGRIVGYAKAGTWRERAAYQWTVEVGVYLAPSACGRGLGTALYGQLLSELARRDFRSAIAGVTLPNDASLALHRRSGFISVGVVREAGYKLGAWHDIELMQKRFSS